MGTPEGRVQYWRADPPPLLRSHASLAKPEGVESAIGAPGPTAALCKLSRPEDENNRMRWQDRNSRSQTSSVRERVIVFMFRFAGERTIPRDVRSAPDRVHSPGNRGGDSRMPSNFPAGSEFCFMTRMRFLPRNRFFAKHFGAMLHACCCCFFHFFFSVDPSANNLARFVRWIPCNRCQFSSGFGGLIDFLKLPKISRCFLSHAQGVALHSDEGHVERNQFSCDSAGCAEPSPLRLSVIIQRLLASHRSALAAFKCCLDAPLLAIFEVAGEPHCARTEGHCRLALTFRPDVR